jgi:hypothetical protein
VVGVDKRVGAEPVEYQGNGVDGSEDVMISKIEYRLGVKVKVGSQRRKEKDEIRGRSRSERVGK